MDFRVEFRVIYRKWFSVVCTLIDTDIRHRSGQDVVDLQGAVSPQQTLNHFRFVFTTVFNDKKVLISQRDQNHDTKKEQALSLTFSQYDWFISQNERS